MLGSDASRRSFLAHLNWNACPDKRVTADRVTPRAAGEYASMVNSANSSSRSDITISRIHALINNYVLSATQIA